MTSTSAQAADRIVDNLADMSSLSPGAKRQHQQPSFLVDDEEKQQFSSSQAHRLAAAYPRPTKQLELSVSPIRQKTRQQKVESEEIFFDHCARTYKEEFNYFNAMTEPSASAFHHLRARQSVHRNYVEKDRNLEYGFLSEDFFDGRELIEIIEEEFERRNGIEKQALADEDQKLLDLLGQGSKEAELRTKLRASQADEQCERSKLIWQWQKSVRELQQVQNKAFLVHHHKETCRVNDEKREIFFAFSAQTVNAKSAAQLVREELQDETERQLSKGYPSNNINNTTSGGAVLLSSSSSSSSSHNNDNSNNKNANRNLAASGSVFVSNSSSNIRSALFPIVSEIDFTFLIEYEEKSRQLIERTALQEFRSAERALRSFQVDALNDIDILRLRKAETLKRAYITGWAFRFHLLMLQELEAAARECIVAVEEKQVRRQIDAVENRCWLRTKETETWRADRERTFAVAEERKQRERSWQKERLDEEDRRIFLRHELETRIETSREEHYERSIVVEQHEREFGVLRRKQIASEVEQEVSSNTLHWTEQFHAQIVVTERQKRRQLHTEEAHDRSELLSLEVRDYIAARRDELFDKDTADAMKHIDKVRDRDGELNASTLPIRLYDNNNNNNFNNVFAPHPPSSNNNNNNPVISYLRNASSSSVVVTTGASLRAPRVS